MKSKPDSNKYDRKTLELQKKPLSFKTEQKKKSQGFFIRVTFHSFLRGHIFAYFINTAKSKRKKKCKYWLYLGNCPLVITDTLRFFFEPLCAEYFIGHTDQYISFTLKQPLVQHSLYNLDVFSNYISLFLTHNEPDECMYVPVLNKSTVSIYRIYLRQQKETKKLMRFSVSSRQIYQMCKIKILIIKNNNNYNTQHFT